MSTAWCVSGDKQVTCEYTVLVKQWSQSVCWGKTNRRSIQSTLGLILWLRLGSVPDSLSDSQLLRTLLVRASYIV